MKRWFSGLLAAVMVLLLLPASASGEDPKYYVSLGSTATSAEVNKPVSVALFMRQEPGDLTYNTFFFSSPTTRKSLHSRVPLSATAAKLPPLSTTTLTLDC